MAMTALQLNDSLRDDYTRLVHERREPADLQEPRRDAWQRLETQGFPSLRQEQWRFTDLAPLADLALRRAGDSPVDADQLPPAVADRVNRLVFVNGRYAPGLSQFADFPDGALIASLGQALLTHPEQVVAHLGRLPGLEEHAFADLNTALWEDGVFIHLPRGTVLSTPLHLVYLAAGDQTANYPRNLIVLEEDSEAVVVEDYRGAGEGHNLTCPLTEIRLGQNARLDYHKVQEEADEAWHLGVIKVCQERDSRLQGHCFSGGGRLTRSDLFVRLDGEGAECDFRGLSLVADGQSSDYHTRVEHTRPHGFSQQLFKGVLDDKSQTVFDGMIYVAPGAQKTVAIQNNRNLLLTRRGVANSNPRLEILADDVKCNHGSTIGFLDPEHLFYLRSRGIGREQGRAMLVYAFANESMEDIRLEPLRRRLENVLVGRLYPEALKRL